MARVVMIESWVDHEALGFGGVLSHCSRSCPGLDFPPGVLAAVGSTPHDLAVSRREVPVHELIDTPQWTDVPMVYTIGITDPEPAVAQAALLSGVPGLGVVAR